jgi:hypothetical protein
MKRPALIATVAIILAACESAAPVAPASPDVRGALFAASGAAGVCNAVFAQLEHRGTVEEHVLAAAARQNAELIVKLESELKKLASLREPLEKQLAELDAKIAKLDPKLQEEIARLEAQLAKETDPERRAKIEAELQRRREEFAKLAEPYLADRKKLVDEIAKIDARIAEIRAQLARGGC